ncbi:2OG-Fe(II) oxygenase [Leptolyngbya sp. FACHB-711]|uniref:prolyl hydroxylase family protein n=1 Tax=unclassified Leptolyngbya TaxID=2650499 RepID=UPI001688EE35|nr:2OG-Fe(II) oxygenase [Leptolyngbya sp. FACHB-711]MBD1849127.1 2OG-Fe(II) oxygenase [Cyanobacteria bacterium FACHB-502]MBD2028152.1 2OG-Fe(II) oxygenase [Leptolyngbya sp. FACHB-711]
MATVLEVLEEEGIAVVDNFITPLECNLMLEELEFTHWQDSVVVKYIGNENSPAYLSNMRKSQTSGQIWFSDEINAILTLIEERLACLLSTTRNHFEEWQATRYNRNDRFDYHVDGGNWERTAAGERKRSIIMYLDTPVHGGETHFRAFDRTIEAKAGRVLIWNNLLPTGKCNFAMIHAGLPVEEGTKTILVSWERERRLRP